MATAASPMTASQFDDRNIQWRELAGFPIVRGGDTLR
jgi:hypothetical protein